MSNVVRIYEASFDKMMDNIKEFEEEINSADGLAVMWYNQNENDIEVTVYHNYKYFPDFIYSMNVLIKKVLENTGGEG